MGKRLAGLGEGSLLALWGMERENRRKKEETALVALLHGVVLVLVLVPLVVVLDLGVLVLHVLAYEVIAVALGLGELHLVHALSGVPEEEGLAPVHGCELLGDALEDLLKSGAVADEGGGHLQAPWWDIAAGGLDVVGDPLDEVAAVLGLDVEHLLVNLLSGHASSEDSGSSEISSETFTLTISL